MTSTAPPGPTGPHSLPPLNLAAIRDYFRGINSRLNLLETNRQPIPSRLANLNDMSPMAYAQDGNVPTYQQSTGTYVPKTPGGLLGVFAVISFPAISAPAFDESLLNSVGGNDYASWASLILLPFGAGPVISEIGGQFYAPLGLSGTARIVGVVSNADGSELLNFDDSIALSAGATTFVFPSLLVASSVGSDLSSSGGQIISAGGGIYAWQAWIAIVL